MSKSKTIETKHRDQTFEEFIRSVIYENNKSEKDLSARIRFVQNMRRLGLFTVDEEPVRKPAYIVVNKKKPQRYIHVS